METSEKEVNMDIKCKYDIETQKWFNAHPFHCTTVCRCNKCGLFYKPSLGHVCKESVNTNETRRHK